MKLGLAIEGERFETLTERAVLAESAGIDIAWLPLADLDDSALIRAAAIAAGTASIRIAASVPIGTHPLEIAEAIAVTDNCCGGRLAVVLEGDEEGRSLFEETLDVIAVACRPRPFRHAGPRWRIPANLPENDQHEDRVIVTPFLVQLELPIWLRGAGAAELAGACLRPVVTPLAATEGHPPDQSGAPARVLEVSVTTPADGSFAVEPLVAALIGHRAAWSSGIALLRLPGDLSDLAWATAVDRLARHVRPRLVLDALPDGLDEHWKAALAK